MTTEEFMKEIEKLGLKVGYIKEHDDVIYYKIEGEYYCCYGWVDCTKDCIANMDKEAYFSNQEKQRNFFKIVTEYITTIIKKRGPKRYFQYKLKPIWKADKKNNLDNLTWLNFKKQTQTFSLSFKQEDAFNQTIFEENDPLLGDNVNLEMFDAIEVDADGNEI